MKLKLLLFVFFTMFATSTMFAEELKVSVYPNPSDGNFINVNFIEHDGENVEITLFSALGNIVYQQEFRIFHSGQTVRITPSEKLQKGIYMIAIKTNSSEITRRVIVRY